MVSPPSAATVVQDLRIHLLNISNEVANISNWTVPLNNGSNLAVGGRLSYDGASKQRRAAKLICNITSQACLGRAP